MPTPTFRSIGNIPINSAVVAACYPSLRAPRKKISALEAEGTLIRLKRGMFVVNPEVSGVPLSTELVANMLYAPSYVSMHTALCYWGMIPEAVYRVQSMTLKHSRTFQTPLGTFDYRHIDRMAFSIGLTNRQEGRANFIIATPEKALCDLIAQSSDVNLRYKAETLSYLQDYLRLDMEAFAHFRRPLLEQYAVVGKKAGCIRTLLKLLP